MMKVTVLYGHPSNPEEFEDYYAKTHLPLVDKIEGLDRAELTRFVSDPAGEKPAYYRMAELYFTTQEQMDESLGAAEGQAAVADIDNFASGGVTVIVGTV